MENLSKPDSNEKNNIENARTEEETVQLPLSRQTNEESKVINDRILGSDSKNKIEGSSKIEPSDESKSYLLQEGIQLFVCTESENIEEKCHAVDQTTLDFDPLKNQLKSTVTDFERTKGGVNLAIAVSGIDTKSDVRDIEIAIIEGSETKASPNNVIRAELSNDDSEMIEVKSDTSKEPSPFQPVLEADNFGESKEETDVSLELPPAKKRKLETEVILIDENADSGQSGATDDSVIIVDDGGRKNENDVTMTRYDYTICSIL